MTTPNRISAIDASTSIRENGEERDLAGVVHARHERRGVETQHRGAVEGIAGGDDAVGDRIPAGENTREAGSVRRLRIRIDRALEDDLAPRVEAGVRTKVAERSGAVEDPPDLTTAAEKQTRNHAAIRGVDASLEQHVAAIVDRGSILERRERPGRIGDDRDRSSLSHEYAVAEVAAHGVKSDPA